MVEVTGFINTDMTISNVGVKLHNTVNDILYDWQLTVAGDTYTSQFFLYHSHMPLCSHYRTYPSTYYAVFGMFDSLENLVYQHSFSFVLG